MASRRIKAVIGYSLFTFELLHNLHPGISGWMKNCKVAYLLSDRLRTRGAQKQTETFVKIRGLVLGGGNVLLSVIESNAKFRKIPVHFSKGMRSSG